MNSAFGNLQQLEARAARTGDVLPNFQPSITVQIMPPSSPPAGQDINRGRFSTSVVQTKLFIIYSYSWHTQVCYRLIVYLFTSQLKVTERFQRDEVLELSYVLCYIHCNENPIYVFPRKELRGLNPNFHIHVSVSDFYIPRIGPHIFLQQIRQTNRGNV